MKAPLAFDPRDHEYGPGTDSIRALLTTWADIDWFETAGTSDADVDALFHEHHARAHAVSPELVPATVETSIVRGHWPEFVAWCKRVRAQTPWDWKFGILKRLSREHAESRAWRVETWASRMPELSERPGDLVVRYRDAKGEQHVIWHGVCPRLAGLAALPRDPIGDSGGFYLSYAHGDVLDAIQWQLAEAHDDVGANPFDSLVRCYHAGIYPFSLDRSTVVLFRWT